MSVRSNTLEPDAISAIVNCLCPECGGVIELETNRLECLRCGKHWRQVWERIRLRTEQGKAIVADEVIDKRR